MSAGIEVNGTEVVITVAGESRKFKVEYDPGGGRSVRVHGAADRTQATNLDWYACAFDALIRHTVDQALRQDSINHQFLGEFYMPFY